MLRACVTIRALRGFTFTQKGKAMARRRGQFKEEFANDSFAQPKASRLSKAGATNGLGFAAMAISVICAGMLALVGLSLPPFSVFDRGTGLANGASISGGDVQAKDYDPDTFLSSPPTGAEHIAASLPANLVPRSPIYTLTGDANTAPSLTLQIRQGEPTRLDVYAYDPQGKRWRFVPADRTELDLKVTLSWMPQAIGLFEANTNASKVAGMLAPGQAITEGALGALNIFHPLGMKPALSGALDGVLPAGFSFAAGYGVVPLISDAGEQSSAVGTLLTDATLRQTHITRLVEFAISRPYSGLALHYEGVAADQRDAYVAFMRDLATALHKEKRTLTVVLPWPDLTSAGSGPYDYPVLGGIADAVYLAAPQTDSTGDKQTFADVMAWLLNHVARNKVFLTNTPAEAQTTRVALAEIFRYNVAGVVYRDFSSATPEMLEAVIDFRLHQPDAPWQIIVSAP
jgi:hypothetical protein